MAADAQLSKRERQIMDVLYEREEAAAADVHKMLPDAPSYTAVRTMLKILEEKGYVRHRQEGRRYVYRPCQSTRVEGRWALQRVLRVFFGGSLEQALAAHLNDPKAHVDQEELERLRLLLEQADPPPKAKRTRSSRSK